MEKKQTRERWHFFAVSSNGTITAAQCQTTHALCDDSGLAGGTSSLGNYMDEEKNALSTMKMQMEGKQFLPAVYRNL